MKLSINGEIYEYITDYKDIDRYRLSLSQLTKKTYGFDFEEWYQKGYWSNKYIPYSLVHQDHVVANVSVNPIEFMISDKVYHTVQIGTVMTDKVYRNKGLCRVLLDNIIMEYENKCDLMYLYANDTVVDFYPKFGFVKEKEYVYTKSIIKKEKALTSRKLDIRQEQDKDLILRLVNNTISSSEITMLDNPGLVMFYLTSFMTENIYYIEALELVAISEEDGDLLYLQDVFCEKDFDLDEVINALIARNRAKVVLGFTPRDRYSYQCEEIKAEGETFFTRGMKWEMKGRFPVLSHA
jgi:GNAT superfamily N-acetyltransferase